VGFFEPFVDVAIRVSWTFVLNPKSFDGRW